MTRTRLAFPLLVAVAALGAPHGASGAKSPPTTTLLFSFVSNTGGFDTGIAIANTTADPFETTPQDGTCTLGFFGTNPPAAAVVTPTVAAGTVFVNTISALAPGFQGYLIAECEFPLAHGFAFVHEAGTIGFAAGQLAHVIPPRKRKSGERLDH